MMRTWLCIFAFSLSLGACEFDRSGLASGTTPPPVIDGGGGGAPDAPPIDGPGVIVIDAAPIDAPIDAVYGDPWVDTDYPVRVRLTVNNPGVEETLSDVPALVVLSTAAVDYDIIDADGHGVAFFDNAGARLPHEIERWNPGGDSALWVRLPEIPDSSNPSFWLYYGKPDAPDETNSPGVWSNGYRAVWHLAEEGLGANHDDATGNGSNVGSRINNTVAPDGIDAIGRAQNFDGNSDHIAFGNVSGFRETDDTLTLLARVQARSVNPNGIMNVIGSSSNSESDGAWQLFWNNVSSETPNGWAGNIRIDNGDTEVVRSDLGTLDSWQLLALTYDGDKVRLYVDGEEVSEEDQTGSIDSLIALRIGDNMIGSGDFDGYIDEVRISGVTRSASWLKVQHESLSQNLIEFGATECLGGDCPSAAIAVRLAR